MNAAANPAMFGYELEYICICLDAAYDRRENCIKQLQTEFTRNVVVWMQDPVTKGEKSI